MGWPQILMIAIFVMNFTVCTLKHGEDRKSKYSMWWAVVAIGVWASILYAGGFWS